MNSTSPGTAWVVLGAPGSGKSTLARPLSVAEGASLLDRDTLTTPLTRVVAELVGAAPDDVDDPRVRAALGDQPYEALLEVAAENLGLGHDVLVVAPFTLMLASMPRALTTHRRLGEPPMRVVHATCPDRERIARLRRRGAPRDERKLASGALSAPVNVVVPHALVDTTQQMADQVRAALRAPRLVVERSTSSFVVSDEAAAR